MPLIRLRECHEKRYTRDNCRGNKHRQIHTAEPDAANISGVMFRFIDTAGIRETNDKIESIGIEKTFKAVEQASIVLLMLDASIAMFQWSNISDKLLPLCHDKHLIVVFNKCDLIDESHEPLLKQLLPEKTNSVFISAKEKKNIDKLQKLLVKASSIDKADNEDVIITNLRCSPRPPRMYIPPL